MSILSMKMGILSMTVLGDSSDAFRSYSDYQLRRELFDAFLCVRRDQGRSRQVHE